ncbi:TIGR03862 family flavoprotein [Hymenobacter sp. J193]|uniref:NAD(P)/FAD-dependent oxidoreductase n=1 Tax=Hymenobacter sp. J193 TaxID=2898429 RepID=UPI002151856D|nr:NAD(P)-dependent oxidoreductase [Hymenobacter sp. J193]MCR5889809.1 TIGR03862 family flavoprotein [Hymenobacter sp. J193]
MAAYFCRVQPASSYPEIAIIGGGPAAMLAAQRLAEAGRRVAVFEAQNTVGRKFLVAGHGGFNLTNAEPAEAFAGRYGPHAALFHRFLTHFSPADLRAWALDLGIDTFVGTSGRVFPRPEHKPADLLRAWLRRLHTLGVQVHTRHRWLGFAGASGLRLLNETTGEETVLHPAATLLALGGASWAKTGSDGRWVPLLEELGIRCVPFAPGNCGAEVAWSDFFREKVGRAPLKNVALSCLGLPVRGEIMLTDYGLEGTPVYALTPELRTALADGAPAQLHLNLKPDVPLAQLTEKLRQRRATQSWPKFLAETLRLKPPVPTLLRELVPELPTNADALARLLTHLPIPIAGLRPLEEAISSAGGVAWPEVTEELMLRQRPGTFVAGEMLDWEAPTGGYLLQGCFSTGAWVARAMLGYLKQD